MARSLTTKKELKGKHARWVEQLSEFPGVVYEHCSGTSNVVADALSRAPVSQTISNLSPEGSISTPLSLLTAPSNNRDSGVVAVVAACLSPPAPRKLTSVEMGLRQRRDAALSKLIDAVEGWVDERQNPPTQADFRLFDGVLYKKAVGRGGRWRLAVLKTLWWDITRSCHDDSTSGYEGQDKTVKRVMARFWWPGLRAYVRDYVERCTFCIMRKTPRTLPSGPMEPGPAPTQPFRVWSIDHLGPFPCTSKENKYALVMVGYFSKFMVAVALPNAKTKAAGRVFRDEILYKYGVPEQVVSDQGTAFTSGIWAEQMETLGIQHSFAAAEHQQTNGLVERNNGVLVDRLAAFIEETPDVWDAQLSAAVFAINTSVQASTLTVPFQALFGLLPRLPVEALLPQVPDPEAGEGRDEQMERLRASMAARSQAAQQRQKANYDRRRLPTQAFSTGDLVVVRRKATKKGIPKKLQPRYVGPFEIARQLSATTYEVRDLPGNRARGRFCLFPAHTCQLKRWRIPRSAGDDDDQPGTDSDDEPDVGAPEEGPPECSPTDEPIDPVGDEEVPLAGEPVDDNPPVDGPNERANSTDDAANMVGRRRPQRARLPPAALRDYVVNLPGYGRQARR